MKVVSRIWEFESVARSDRSVSRNRRAKLSTQRSPIEENIVRHQISNSWSYASKWRKVIFWCIIEVFIWSDDTSVLALDNPKNITQTIPGDDPPLYTSDWEGSFKGSSGVEIHIVEGIREEDSSIVISNASRVDMIEFVPSPCVRQKEEDSNWFCGRHGYIYIWMDLSITKCRTVQSDSTDEDKVYSSFLWLTTHMIDDNRKFQSMSWNVVWHDRKYQGIHHPRQCKDEYVTRKYVKVSLQGCIYSLRSNATIYSEWSRVSIKNCHSRVTGFMQSTREFTCHTRIRFGEASQLKTKKLFQRTSEWEEMLNDSVTIVTWENPGRIRSTKSIKAGTVFRSSRKKRKRSSWKSLHSLRTRNWTRARGRTSCIRTYLRQNWESKKQFRDDGYLRSEQRRTKRRRRKTRLKTKSNYRQS